MVFFQVHFYFHDVVLEVFEMPSLDLNGVSEYEVSYPATPASTEMSLLASNLATAIQNTLSPKCSINVYSESQGNVFSKVVTSVIKNYSSSEDLPEDLDFICCSVPWARNDPSEVKSAHQSYSEYVVSAAKIILDDGRRVIREFEKTHSLKQHKNKSLLDGVENPKHFSVELILNLASKLSTNGIGIFNFYPFGIETGFMKFCKILLKQAGLRLTNYVQISAGDQTQVFAIIKREDDLSSHDSELTVYEVNEASNLDAIVDEILKEGVVAHGTTLKNTPFVGFETFKIERQIDRLVTRYKDYQKVKFPELLLTYDETYGTDANTIKHFKEEDFDKIPQSGNFLYCNGWCNPWVTTDFGHATQNFKDIWLLELTDQVSAHYLEAFFHSEIGSMIADLCRVGGAAPELKSVKVTRLLDFELPVPPRSIQEQIYESFVRLTKIEDNLKKIKNELAVNPESTSVREQLDAFLSFTSQLSKADAVKSMILQRENGNIEFKQTFQLSVHTGEKDDRLELACLKTIAGFMNSDGGVLLIGVHDDLSVTGLSTEITKFHKSSQDKYLLNFQQKVENRLGKQALTSIRAEFVDVDDAVVLLVHCPKILSRDIFVDDARFYVRTPAATIELKGVELLQYTKTGSITSSNTIQT